MTRCGHVAIVGRPNVGKSTLLNRLLGESLAIVSPKPQTTRTRILGILTRGDAQLILLDTPGIHKSTTLLGKQMNRAAQYCLEEADVILLMVDAMAGWVDEDELAVDLVRRACLPEGERGRQAKKPALLAINKVDAARKEMLLPIIHQAARLELFKEIVPISATTGDQVPILLDETIKHLPEGPKLFPDDQLTDQPERFLVAELIREQALAALREEVPYGVAVVIEEMTDREDKPATYIRATIYVEKESQKPILIGARGNMLKAIGQRARQAIQPLLRRAVYLELWVKVAPNWRQDPQALRRFGYA